MYSRVRALCVEFIRDESAEELAEYSLLALFVALAGLAIWNAIVGQLGIAYDGYNTNVQDEWEPPDP